MAVPVRLFIINIKRYMLILFVFALISTLLFCIFVIKWTNKRNCLINATQTTLSKNIPFTTVKYYKTNSNELISAQNFYNNSELRLQLLKKKLERISRKVRKSKAIELNSTPALQLNYNVHIFYYAWYGNLDVNGEYSHWNHEFLPNWKIDDKKINPTGAHQPPDDIGSNFYPQLGCYSSADSNVINLHFKQLRDAGVGVVIISWTPPGFKDSPEGVMNLLFDYAEKYELKIAPHIEPYSNRNPINFHKYLREFFDRYSNKTSLYRMKKPLGNDNVPVVYIYDSYLIPATAWKELFSAKGNLSLRGTKYDAIFLGLLVDMQHRAHIKKGHFDGFYTYFASNGFTYGSSWKNWRSLAKFSRQFGLIFVPSVGPGYIDTQVRPWNLANTKHRRHGQYFEVAWRAAINNRVNYISITSFNEWHEGTQIEPAVPKTLSDFTYLDYEPEGPNFYLNLTKWWIQQFNKSFS